MMGGGGGGACMLKSNKNIYENTSLDKDKNYMQKSQACKRDRLVIWRAFIFQNGESQGNWQGNRNVERLSENKQDSGNIAKQLEGGFFHLIGVYPQVVKGNQYRNGKSITGVVPKTAAA